MEKQQVSTFLKILQIPSNAPPEDIKASLLESGWNDKDAEEAIAVLYPHYDQDEATSGDYEQQDASQIVAQKYVRTGPEPEQSSTSSVAAAPTAPATYDAVAPSSAPEAGPAFTPEDEAPVPEKAPIPQNLDPQAEKERPHTDAPWLQQQVDIYDVTPEEKERMIRTVYRTNERLSPQTIHALLGIDVDLSEYEAAYRERQKDDTLDWVQISIILLSSIAIASIALLLGLYYFEVGPFHPTITGGR